jgi:preprotein translocase subunit SecD
MVYFAKWKIIVVVGLCLLGVIYAAPNLLQRETADSIPGWLPHKQVSLGLDLQGGSHILLEVDVASVIRERLAAMVDSVRTALRKARIGYTDLGITGNGVTVTIREDAELSRARGLIRQAEQGTELTYDGNIVQLTLTEVTLRERRRAAVEQSIEIVRRRIDETGVREPTIQSQGSDRILVQLPGVKDPERIKRLLGKTAKLHFRLLDLSVSPEELRGRRPPPGSQVLPADDEIDPVTGQPVLYLVRKRVIVNGDMLLDAQPTIESGRPVVSFRFDATGARKFGKVTTQNVGKPFAIVLDNKVISAPVIREPILGGSGIISGRFTTEQAQDLSLLLRAGALPAPLRVLEERTVGPGLGADSIRAGKIASVLALVIVVVFMFMTYGIFGLMADVALLLNIVLIGAVLSLLQATLTLPGIAGIVLTIGMAVDANVLVFERIREEQRAGRTPISAVDAGYRRALKTIIDANLTTLIAAVLLFMFGSGPIKGFAVTLAIGLVTSLFTAIMVTRMVVVWWLRRKRPQVLPI